MAKIFPFRAVTYKADSAGDVTDLVAPPYDVISVGKRVELISRHENNVAGLVLPESRGEMDKYDAAARDYAEWSNAGVFDEDEKPVFYLWDQRFTVEGREISRKALVAKTSCEPYSVGGVMRHEYTHAGPKADRLALFTATGMQFSQMFGIFADKDASVAKILAGAAKGEVAITAKGDDGHVSRLYRIDDAAIIERLQDLLDKCTITIADGHHRYETTVAYYEKLGRKGTTLMTLVPDSDPGLIVLPTHRVIDLGETEYWDERLTRAGLQVETLGIDEGETRFEALSINPRERSMVIALPTANEVKIVKWAESHNAERVYARLGDVGVLHDVILPILSEREDFSEVAQFKYIHDALEAVMTAQDSGSQAFLLRPTPVRILLALAERQEVMPPKSTYFYPKFLSGFVNAKLD